ncbi:centromere binding protein B, DNA binding protein [Ostertagia ostertagi]
MTDDSKTIEGAERGQGKQRGFCRGDRSATGRMTGSSTLPFVRLFYDLRILLKRIPSTENNGVHTHKYERLAHAPVSPAMKRRKSYTAAFKLDAVNYRDLHGTLAAARHFEVIRERFVDRQNLQEMPATKRARRYKKPSVEEVEDAIYNWVVKKREENRAVTVKEIRTKAKELAEEHGHQNFKASAHWCSLFMARKKLSVRRTSVGQPLPSDHLQKCSDFRKFVAAGALNGRENIKIDSTGYEKSNFTVVLGVTAAGEKLKPMLIFKKKLMPKGQFPPDVIVKTNEKGIDERMDR